MTKLSEHKTDSEVHKDVVLHAEAFVCIYYPNRISHRVLGQCPSTADGKEPCCFVEDRTLPSVATEANSMQVGLPPQDPPSLKAIPLDVAVDLLPTVVESFHAIIDKPNVGAETSRKANGLVCHDKLRLPNVVSSHT